MRTLLPCTTFAAVMLVATVSSADPISVGDLIKFQSSTGTIGGGAFLVDNTANGTGVDFTTFCLQMTQHIDYSSLFRVGGITDFADDAGGNDPLSTATAWIFSSFRAGLLTGYSANEIQGAIWTLEDEWTSSAGNQAALITLAQNHVAAGWVNDGVGVLNLFYTDGRKAQDQLTYNKVAALPPPPPVPTPEPATLLLMGVGGVVLGSRKRLRRHAAGSAHGVRDDEKRDEGSRREPR
ncbi:MAG TPA: PEP-CTERM sorting domain-containing protein [Vicinamibacterales bacterium]|nr:PEP-CTERM sorting domain-containing protein [Vicinamibacterales bacterium]